MCGIVGFIDFEKKLSTKTLDNLIISHDKISKCMNKYSKNNVLCKIKSKYNRNNLKKEGCFKLI